VKPGRQCDVLAEVFVEAVEGAPDVGQWRVGDAVGVSVFARVHYRVRGRTVLVAPAGELGECGFAFRKDAAILGAFARVARSFLGGGGVLLGCSTFAPLV